jgi:putative acetyltransferase
MSTSQAEPEPIHADGVIIRTQRPEDRPSVRDVIVRAFESDIVADLAESLQDAPAGADGLSYVAEQAANPNSERAADRAANPAAERAANPAAERAANPAAERAAKPTAERATKPTTKPAAERAGQIVGHVQLSRSWVDAPERLLEVLVLSPLSVAPEQQRHGIGGQLVRHALSEATRLGAPLVFLEGAPAYYSRFGFETASQRGFTAPSVRIPDAGFQVVILPSYAPWMTGALVYAEQFWAYDCVGLR